jgi:methanogenic corrinoid protein MtbC1
MGDPTGSFGVDPGGEARSFAAGVLRSGGRALAAHAAERLLSSDPSAGAPFGAGAFRGWHDHLSQRVNDLAAAVELDSPELFARDVSWSMSAFAARSVGVGALRASLSCLRDAVRLDLSAAAATAAMPALERGIAAASGEPMAMERLSVEGRLGELAGLYLEAVLSGRRREAIAMLVAALERGEPLASLYERVLLPVGAEVGTMWHLGEISVPEEHAATEATRSAMAVLSHAAPRAGARHEGVVLVGAVEGDRHDIGVRAVADLAEQAGWPAVSLGGDVPVRDIVSACESFGAGTLILSAMMSGHLPALAGSIRAVRGAGLSPRVIVGGRAFGGDASLARRVGAEALASSPSGAVALIG